MLRFRWTALLLVLVSILIGCGPQVPSYGGTPRTKVIRKAVSLSPSTSEIVGLKATNVQLVGRTASCNFPSHITAAKVVLNGTKPNYEQIVALQPDAVLYDPALFSEVDLAKFKELGIETFGIGENTVDGFIRRLYEFGAKFSAEVSMMDYVGDIERAISTATAAAPKPAPTVAIMMPDPRGAHYIAGVDSFVADVVRKAGGSPVGPQSKKFELASIEALVTWNPDLIICSPKYEDIANDPRLQGIKAIIDLKAGKAAIAQISPDLLLRQGSRVELLIKNVSNFIANRKP